MSARVKIKKVKLPAGVKDEGLAEMFNQMLGTGAINLPIAYGRYIRIRDLCKQLVNVFDMLSRVRFMRHPDLESQREEIEKFCQDSSEKINRLFRIELTGNLDAVEDEVKKQFTEEYELSKKSPLVSMFIKMCDNLDIYKKYISDFDKLSHKFVVSMPGTEWRPLPFTTLNIKYAFTFIGDNAIAVILTVLGKAYEVSKLLYDELQSPDIDVDKFIEVVTYNLTEIQKHPRLNRCGKAFAKIKESISLLKDRFNGYYRDFVHTKDSTIMMQHFILDVSQTTKADPVVTGQFRTIISYYRELAQNQITNPKFKMLFDKVNDSFRELDKENKNLVEVDNGKEFAEEPPNETVSIAALATLRSV